MKYNIGDYVIYKLDNTIYTDVRILDRYKDNNTYKLRGFEHLAFEDELYKIVKLK